MTLLVVFGLLFCFGVLYVVVGGIAVVLMPIVMGREGVGTAMITLFTVCLTFVVSGILLLAARSAARVIRRESGSVRSLYTFARASTILSVLVGAIMLWLRFAFFNDNAANSSLMGWPLLMLIVPLFSCLLFARSAIVLRRYSRILN